MGELRPDARQGDARKRANVKARVDRWGYRTVCLGCGSESYRHKPHAVGRLRHQRCPACRRPGAMRLRSWVLKHPELARAKRTEFDKIEYVLSDLFGGR